MVGPPPAAASTIALISRFAITRDDQPYFEDTFSGAQASVLAPRLADGQRTEYAVIGFIPDGSAASGRLALSSANGSLSSTADRRGRRQTGVRLMTDADPRNARAGLKRGFTFSMSGLFDFVTPGGPVEGYGIRFADISDGRQAAHVANLFVFKNEAGALVVRFLHQDFAGGKQHVLEDAPIEPGAGEQILLELSHGDPKSDEVTARYQFWKNGAPAGGPILLRGAAPIFQGGDGNWTRAGFFAFEQAARQ